MRKNDFINELAQTSGISVEEATKVNEIVESHGLIGKKSKEAVVLEISEALNIDGDAAEKISNDVYDILANAMKEKLKHPFAPKG